MKKLLYITYVDFKKRDFIGVIQKIMNHSKILTSNGYLVDMIYQTDYSAVFRKENSSSTYSYNFFKFKRLSVLIATYKTLLRNNYNFVYIRFQFFSFDMLLMLICLKWFRCHVTIEIPTFPYEKELLSQGLRGFSKLIIDRTFRGMCSLFVDLYVNPLTENSLFGRKTVKIENGIDFDDYNLIENLDFNSNEIKLVAVASMLPWHGYDRIIKGLSKYYSTSNRKYSIYIDLIGSGKEVIYYKELVAQFELNNYVMFHGAKSGDELFNIVKKCNIAVGSLAGHRIGLDKMSTLKSREYCAWGLPSINSTKVDIISKQDKNHLYVDENDDPINMDDVIEFYKILKAMNLEKPISQSIRESAKEKSDVKILFKKIINIYEDVK